MTWGRTRTSVRATRTWTGSWCCRGTPPSPWSPTRLHLNGELYDQDSRNVLVRQVEAAADMGLIANVGIEPEFYVVRETPEGWEPLIPGDRLNSPTRGYDLEATVLAEPFLDPMVRYMNGLGWGVYSFDHEGGDGQYEFNFAYTDALTMADQMVLFRLMAKHVAREVGCVATFMPKPFQDDFGSASHINISLADAETGANVFAADDGSSAYAEIAGHFVAGVLAHAGAISAVTCPTVNSYKRFTSKGFMDEISWAPIYRAWGENNRTLMCRMPVNRHCLEVRTADASVNYHLGIALVLAAGLEGIRHKLEPGKPLNADTYKMSPEELAPWGDLSIPRTLDEAVDEFERDDLAREVFGAAFHATYVAHKRAESHEYRSVVTDYETRTLMQRL